MDAIVASVQKAAWARTERMLAAKLEAVRKGPGTAAEKSRQFCEIGSMAMALGRFPEAVVAFDRSIEAWGRNWDAHQLRAGSLIKLGRLDDADKALTELSRRAVQRARTFYNLACLSSRRAEAAVGGRDAERPPQHNFTSAGANSERMEAGRRADGWRSCPYLE
jgi:Flp pilus assembly protein TadD